MEIRELKKVLDQFPKDSIVHIKDGQLVIQISNNDSFIGPPTYHIIKLDF